MITQLRLKNFKNIADQVYDFTQFDLLVGRNNSGKSTVLQALAIWQYCVDEFHRTKRSGSKGIQVVLPNFTALPVPEFNLLWKDRTDRHWPIVDGKKKQEYILISIRLHWTLPNGEADSFEVELRYHSPQTIYAIPSDGWEKFRECERRGDLPKIAYVPPFSGLEPTEKWLDLSPIRQQVGKAQPGSVLRNLLLWVCPPNENNDRRGGKGVKNPDDWQELVSIIERWFSVKIHAPKYDSGKDVYITVEYRQSGKDFDIISAGSGFHQTLTLLAFFYGYEPTTILLDEPDAHLHVNLQREILDYFKRKSQERGIQFLIATHAEEFARGVDAAQIMSLLSRVPTRVASAPDVLRAMADVSNEEITRLLPSPYILYVEGEDDERILRAWAEQCGAQTEMDQICFKAMGGGGKANMKTRADSHFSALQQIIPGIKRLMLFDYDTAEEAFHPAANNPTLAEWKRKNIENYLLVPDAWKRTVLKQLQCDADDLFAQPVLQKIDAFFVDQNLTLPPGRDWKNVTANIFSVVDGKRILYGDNDSLFQQLLNSEPQTKIARGLVAMSMSADEIHDDVHNFIAKVKALVVPPAALVLVAAKSVAAQA
jgi:hypothetical protein